MDRRALGGWPGSFGIGDRISHVLKNRSGESLPPRERGFFGSISHAFILFGRKRSGALSDLMCKPEVLHCGVCVGETRSWNLARCSTFKAVIRSCRFQRWVRCGRKKTESEIGPGIGADKLAVAYITLWGLWRGDKILVYGTLFKLFETLAPSCRFQMRQWVAVENKTRSREMKRCPKQ